MENGPDNTQNTNNLNQNTETPPTPVTQTINQNFIPLSPTTQMPASNHSANFQNKTSSLAIASLIFAFLLPLVGLILSFFAIGKTGPNKEKGRLLAILALVISSLITLAFTLLIIISIAVGGSVFYEFNKILKRDLSSATNTNSSTSSSSTVSAGTSNNKTEYIDAVLGFSFEPGAGMTKSKNSSFLYTGNPFTGSLVTLISSGSTPSTSASTENLKTALQNSKLKSFTGSKPNEVKLATSNISEGYIINYKINNGGQSEVWQFAFYSKKSSNIIVLTITQPYLDSATSSQFLKYAYSVFTSVKTQ